jgi:hypothetical protein
MLQMTVKRHVNTKLGLQIHTAIQGSNIDNVKKLLRQGESLCTNQGDNCFIFAAQHGTSSCVVEEMLKLEPDGVNTKDDKGRSLMWYYASDPCMLLSLLKNGADPHVPAEMPDILVKLLKTKNSDNDVILEVLSKLLAMGVKFEDHDGNCLTKLYNRRTVIRQLIRMGAKVNASFFKMLINNKNSSIIIPVLTNLLAAGADLLVVDDNGCSVVCYATTRYMLKPSTDAFNLLSFLLELPVFSDFIPKCNPGYLPHDILLNNCRKISPTDLKNIFNIIFKSSLKNYKYIKNMTVTIKVVSLSGEVYFKSCNYGFVTTFILKFFKMLPKIGTPSTIGTLFRDIGNRCDASNCDVKNAEDLVAYLLEIGLSLNDSDSPLALFLTLQMKYLSDWIGFMFGHSVRNENFKPILDKIIEAASTDAGCSMQCKKLEVSRKSLQDKLDVFQVPDVLFVACMGSK